MKKVLIIGLVWPESKSSAAGWRMIHLIKGMITSGYEVHFACAAKKTEFSDDLSDLNITESVIKLNDDSFDDYIIGLQPDVVMYDRFIMEEQYGWRIAEYCPGVIRILDTEDLHFLRKARAKASKGGVEVTTESLQNEDAIREVASIYRCDLTLVISEYELNLLTEVLGVPKQLLVYLPFESKEINEEELLPTSVFEEREHFMFIGNFMHTPNYDAVLSLKNDIWGDIRKELPKAQLHIYGAYENHKISQLHNEKEGFLIKGRAESSLEVISKAKVMLVPLRIGAGIKGKLLESMQCGTPSVTTSIGAEGMKGGLDWNGFVEDDPSEFAKKAVKLYRDENLWIQCVKNGIQINNKRFADLQWLKSFESRLKFAIANVSEVRQANFVGKVLQHQTMQSTKYFSRWIEEKNKK